MLNLESLQILPKNACEAFFSYDNTSERCLKWSETCERPHNMILIAQNAFFWIFMQFFFKILQVSFCSNFQAKIASFWKMVIFSSRVEFPARVRFSWFKKLPDLFITSPRRPLEPWFACVNENPTFEKSFHSPLGCPKSKHL